MYVRDLEGNEYAVQCTSTWEGELNGDQFLITKLEPKKPNNLFIHDIAEMWIIADHDDVEYKIIYCKKQGEGDSLTVDIKAIPLFFDDFNMQRIYEVYNQHMTAQAFFDLVFNGSGYDVVIVDSFYAQDWQGIGDGSTRLDNFKRGLERYQAEFRIQGKTVYLESQIGNDVQFQYRYKLNASNIAQEIDAAELFTYAKGYGDFEQGAEDLENNAGLIREYTSPLANVIGIREAPPIKNGSITTQEFMDEQLETLVNESLTVSVTADIHDLREQGYPLAQPQLGDRVFLIDERIGFDQEVRIVDIQITKDWEGTTIDVKLTFGSESITKRHQSNLNTAAKSMMNILSGKQTLPFNVLPAAKQAAMRKLEEAQTELIFGNAQNGVQGIVAQDKNDPNKLFWMNSNGWLISTDGGATVDTAATADGIVANAITSGSLKTNLVSIVGDANYFYWDGTGLHAIDPNDVDKYVRLDSDGLYVAKGAIKIERPDGYVAINDGVLNGDFAVQSANPPFRDTTDSIVTGIWFKVSSSARKRFDRYTFRHTSRYLRIDLVRFVEPGGGAEGIIYMEDNTTGTDLWSLTFNNDSNHPSAEFLQSYDIDLGTPTGNKKSVILRCRSTNQSYPVYMHVGRMSLWG